MGIAAYNRGSAALIHQIDAEARPVEFEIMERLNGIPKYEDAGKPFGLIQFVSGNNGVWAVCPRTGYGFWYRTLTEAVRRWKVTIVAFQYGVWQAEPHARLAREGGAPMETIQKTLGHASLRTTEIYTSTGEEANAGDFLRL